MVDVAHDGDDRRSRLQVLVLVLFLVAEELCSQRSLLLLAWVDQPDLGADLGGEEIDHVVGEGLGRGHHLALEKKETHDVAGGPVQARTELLRRGAPLHDHLVVGNRCARRQVGRYLDRLELLHVPTSAPWPPLRRAPSPDRTTASGTLRTAGGVTAPRREPRLPRPRTARHRGDRHLWERTGPEDAGSRRLRPDVGSPACRRVAWGHLCPGVPGSSPGEVLVRRVWGWGPPEVAGGECQVVVGSAGP